MSSTSQQDPAGLTPLEQQLLLLRNNLSTHVMCSHLQTCRYGDRCMFSHSIEESRVMRAVKEAGLAKGGLSKKVFSQRSSAGVSRTISNGAVVERPASGSSGHRTFAGPMPRTTSRFGRPGQQCRGGQGQGGEDGTAAQQQRQHFCPPSRYKTTLCTYWVRQGECRHADACTFAHGLKELREHTGYMPNGYAPCHSSNSATAPSAAAACGNSSAGLTLGVDAEAERDEVRVAAAHPEEYALQQEHVLRRQHAELDRQLSAAAAIQPPPPPPPRLAAEAARGGRAGMQAMAVVLTKHVSGEWEGDSTTSSGAPTTACLSEPALKPGYSSGPGVQSVGMAESEDGSMNCTTATSRVSRQTRTARTTVHTAHATLAAPIQEQQAAASSDVATEPEGPASVGLAASLPAAECAELKHADAAVFGLTQQAGCGARWADMADGNEEEEEQQQKDGAGEERQLVQQEQDGAVEAAQAGEEGERADTAEEQQHAAALPQQQQQELHASLAPVVVYPTAPLGFINAAAVAATAAQEEVKVLSPLPLPRAQRLAGTTPTFEHRHVSIHTLSTSLEPQAQPACQPAPPNTAAAPHAAAYHHGGPSQHTQPLPPTRPSPRGLSPRPSPAVADAPVGAQTQQPAHPSSVVAVKGWQPIKGQAASQPALQRVSYPTTVDLTLVPAFTCPLTGHLFVNPVVAADGITYEKELITDWLFRQNKEVSPVTGKQLAHRLLLPNDCLRSAMTEVTELIRAMLV